MGKSPRQSIPNMKKIVYPAGLAAAAIGAVFVLRHHKVPEDSTHAVNQKQAVGKMNTGSPAPSRPVLPASQNEKGGWTTVPLDFAWLERHRVPLAMLDADPDGDGKTNRDHMLAGTDPFQGKGSPYQAIYGDKITTVPTPPVPEAALAQRRERLTRLAEQARVEDARSAEATKQRAAELGLSTFIGGPGRHSASLDSFDHAGDPVYMQDSNIALADTSGIDELWPSGSVTVDPSWATGSTGFNLSGAGQTIAMWESIGGVRTDHTQLDTRATQMDSAVPVSKHATMVAGALIASGASYDLVGFDFGNHTRGFAYGAALTAYKLDGFSGEFLSEALDGRSLANLSVEASAGWSYLNGDWSWFGNAANQESHLLGNYLDGTNAEPRRIDNLVNSSVTLLPVIAASNNRGDAGAGEGPGAPSVPGDFYYLLNGTTYTNATRNWVDGDAGGYDTLSPTAVAKNGLTVGACYDLVNGYTTASSVVIAPFSAFGPTDDGRIKPDIVAAGARDISSPRNYHGSEEAIEVAYDPFTPSDVNAYDFGFGTSLAAPVVTGGLSLAIEKRNALRSDWISFPLRASTLRALAIATADEAGPNPGPDFKFGYGLFNAVTAAQTVTADAALLTHPHIKEIYIPSTDLPASFKISAVNSAKPLKTTVAWTDIPGPASTAGAVDPTVKRLMQNLDLTLTSPTSAVTLPWVLTPDLTVKSATTRANAATRAVDSLNNVEQVQVDSPTTTGQYTVSIDAPAGGLPAGGQWVSVIMTNNAVPAFDFRITKIQKFDATHWLLEWNSSPGRLYRVEGSASPFGPWTDISGELSARADTMSVYVESPPLPSYFWRVASDY
jgi:hypothetical protein